MGFIGVQPAKAPLTSSDIADGVVTSAKIADGTIATADIADSAVTAVKTSGVGGDLSFGGDTFGADKVIGANDAYALSFETNNAVGLKIDSAGHVTKPLQSTFMAQQTGALTVANTHTLFSTNTTERWDTNSDYNNSGTFTAPVTGKYMISVNVLFESISSNDVFESRIVSSNRSYAMSRNSRGHASDASYVYNGASVIADLDASDTVYVMHGSSTTASVHVSGNWSFWSIYLLG